MSVAITLTSTTINQLDSVLLGLTLALLLPCVVAAIVLVSCCKDCDRKGELRAFEARRQKEERDRQKGVLRPLGERRKEDRGKLQLLSDSNTWTWMPPDWAHQTFRFHEVPVSGNTVTSYHPDEWRAQKAEEDAAQAVQFGGSVRNLDEYERERARPWLVRRGE